MSILYVKKKKALDEEEEDGRRRIRWRERRMRCRRIGRRKTRRKWSMLWILYNI